jgi:hypothetical protein
MVSMDLAEAISGGEQNMIIFVGGKRQTPKKSAKLALRKKPKAAKKAGKPSRSK